MCNNCFYDGIFCFSIQKWAYRVIVLVKCVLFFTFNNKYSLEMNLWELEFLHLFNGFSLCFLH